MLKQQVAELIKLIDKTKSTEQPSGKKMKQFLLTCKSLHVLLLFLHTDSAAHLPVIQGGKYSLEIQRAHNLHFYTPLLKHISRTRQNENGI